LELRDFVPSDEADVHAYASDPRVTRFLWWGPNTPQETRDFVARVCREAGEHPRRHYELAAVDRASARAIGTAGLLLRRSQYREYELDYCLHREWWGAGYGTEAVRALVDLGFRQLDAHRIYALVDPENPASQRVLEKLGFRREGHQRRDTLIAGEWRDTLVYALLDGEWGRPAKSTEGGS
jgi:RimJ/RimL family protein N-acetyltransferase